MALHVAPVLHLALQNYSLRGTAAHTPAISSVPRLESSQLFRRTLLGSKVVVEAGGEAVLPRIIAAGGRFGVIKGQRYFMVGYQSLADAYLNVTQEPFSYGKNEMREMFTLNPELGMFSYQALTHLFTAAPKAQGDEGPPVFCSVTTSKFCLMALTVAQLPPAMAAALEAAAALRPACGGAFQGEEQSEEKAEAEEEAPSEDEPDADGGGIQVASDISRLPQQLLVLLLQHVEPAQRLSSCALVCQAWKTAAANATVNVRLNTSFSRDCRALSAWLRSHPSKASIDSISLNVPHSPEDLEDDDPDKLWPVVLLPVEELKGLRHLSCRYLSIERAPAAPAAAGLSSSTATTAPAEAEAALDDAAPSSTLPPPAPVFTPDLAALTHLELVYCTVELQGLQHLTALQHFELKRSPRVTTSAHPKVQAQADSLQLHTFQVLCETLPKLQHLTELKLASPACTDAVLQCLSSLPHLMRLSVASSSLTAVGLQALPTSLSQLSLGAVPGSHAITISPSATPTFSQLSALEDVTLARFAGFDTALLANWPRLRILELYETAAIVVPGQLRFQALVEGRNPHLQEVYLEAAQDADAEDAEDAPALSGAELGALTAPSGLTNLTLGSLAVSIHPQSYSIMFPPNRHLPNLLKLQVGLALLTTPLAVQQMVACCPRLRKLLCEHGTAVFDDIDDVDDADALIVESLRSLADLSDLQHLAIGNAGLSLCGEAYAAIGALSQLTQLRLTVRRAFDVYLLMRLTRCRNLKALSVRYATPDDVGAGQWLELYDEAPEGSPPDVSDRIPGNIKDLANLLARDFEDDPRALRCLVQTIDVVGEYRDAYGRGIAAGSQVVQQEQQEQELQGAMEELREEAHVQAESYEEKLRQQERRFSAQLEASQQLVGELQQQVAELRDEQRQQQQQQQEVAALKAALEGLLGRQL